MVLVILLICVTASVPVLPWQIPNLRISFLLKVAGESTFVGPVSSSCNKFSSSILRVRISVRANK